jgi:protein-tyrosine phosphatase
MDTLSDHIKYTTRKIDAFLENYTLGTLVIENGQAFLQLEIGELIQLNDSFIIEVFDGEKYNLISYEQALNTFCADMPDCPLFAGLEARIKRKAVA